MTQGTGKIKLLAAVMYDVVIPEKIYFMAPAVYPITLEIYYKKCDDVKRDRCLYVSDRNFIYQPTISNDSNADTKHIFYNISNSAAKTGNAVKSTNYIEALMPLHNFFNQEKKEKERNGDI